MNLGIPNGLTFQGKEITGAINMQEGNGRWQTAKTLNINILANWDKAMLAMVKEHNILSALPARQLNMDTANKVIIFEKNKLIFVFNFSTGNSIFGYKLWAPEEGIYSIILNSDKKEFGGFEQSGRHH